MVGTPSTCGSNCAPPQHQSKAYCHCVTPHTDSSQLHTRMAISKQLLASCHCLLFTLFILNINAVAGQCLCGNPPKNQAQHQNCSKMLIEDFKVLSDNVVYSEEYITSTYSYDSTQLTRDSKGSWIVSPTSTEYQFRVDRRVPKLGCVPKAMTLSGLASHGPHCGAAVALGLGLTLFVVCCLLQGDAGWPGWQQRHNRSGWHLGKQAVSVLCHRGPGLDARMQLEQSACNSSGSACRLTLELRSAPLTTSPRRHGAKGISHCCADPDTERRWSDQQQSHTMCPNPDLCQPCVIDSILQRHHLDDQGRPAQAQLLGLPHAGQPAAAAADTRQRQQQRLLVYSSVLTLQLTPRDWQDLADTA